MTQIPQQSISPRLFTKDFEFQELQKSNQSVSVLFAQQHTIRITHSRSFDRLFTVIYATMWFDLACTQLSHNERPSARTIRMVRGRAPERTAVEDHPRATQNISAQN